MSSLNDSRPHYSFAGWGAVVVYAGVIFWLSSMSDAPLPQGVSDVSGHAIGYFGLGVLTLRAIVGGLPARVTVRQVLLAIIISVAYGVTDELHQSFVPGRVADLGDLRADAVGAAAGVAACWAWGIIARRSDV